MTDNRYYTEAFPPAIYDSRPISCGETRGYEVHILTREKDRTLAFWALKSFYHYAGERPPLVVHDDGSLSAASYRLFHEHFPGCTVVGEKEAGADPRLREALRAFPLCELWRYRCEFPMAKKLFDFACLSAEPFIVSLDSDLLFFREPVEVVACARTAKPFMSSDYQDAYEFDTALVRSAGQDFDLLPRLNTGLFGLRRDDFDFRVVETLLEAYVDAAPGRRFQFWKAWLEQTLLACLFSRSGGRVLDLSSYQISSMLIGDRTVSQHFVNDGSRSALYTWGLRTLHERGFLDAVS